MLFLWECLGEWGDPNMPPPPLSLSHCTHLSNGQSQWTTAPAINSLAKDIIKGVFVFRQVFTDVGADVDGLEGDGLFRDICVSPHRI